MMPRVPQRRARSAMGALDLLSFINDIQGSQHVVYEVRYYLTETGRDLFVDWMRRLRDATAKQAISRRVLRLGAGNFGDHAHCRDGVWELRIDVGAGYRVYYAVAGRSIVLLLCGGDKRSQAADIDRACNYWRDEKRRLGDAK